jgi:protein involved in polysaccharide export with SLBB domain
MSRPLLNMKSELVIAALAVALSGCTGSNLGKTVPVFSEGPPPARLHANNAANDSPATKSPGNAQSEDVIKAGDILLITFSNSPSGSTMPTFDQRVGDDGTITFIYGNVFHAAGKKTGDLEQEIRDFFVPVCAPNLTIRVRVSEGRFVYAEGEFRNRGRLSWTNGMSLRDAIDLAHGFSDFAGRLTIIHADGTRQRIRLPADKIPLDNPKLEAGDVIRCRGRDI